ncbi:MAG TPA: hypothetical protein VIC55_12770 [Gemmatimonadaceae bacterium]|jgi:hypothetical protein
MHVPRTLRTVSVAVLSLLSAACMGSIFPTEIPPTPGATHANRVMPTDAPSIGSASTTPAGHTVPGSRVAR